MLYVESEHGLNDSTLHRLVQTVVMPSLALLKKVGHEFYLIMYMQERARVTFLGKKDVSCVHYNKCDTCFGKQRDFEQSCH